MSTNLVALLTALGDPRASLMANPMDPPTTGITLTSSVKATIPTRRSPAGKTVAVTVPPNTPTVVHRYHTSAPSHPVVHELVVTSGATTAAPSVANSAKQSVPAPPACQGVKPKYITAPSPPAEPQAVFHGYLNITGQSPPIAGGFQRQACSCSLGACQYPGMMQAQQHVCGIHPQQPCAAHFAGNQFQQQQMLRQGGKGQFPVLESPSPLMANDEYTRAVYKVLEAQNLYPTTIDVVEDNLMNRLRVENAWQNAQRRAADSAQAQLNNMLPDDSEDVIGDLNDAVIDDTDDLGLTGFADVNPDEQVM